MSPKLKETFKWTQTGFYAFLDRYVPFTKMNKAPLAGAFGTHHTLKPYVTSRNREAFLVM